MRLPRKLKKAIKKCISYYDGYYLVLPIKERHTKWMYRVVKRHIYWPEEGEDTKRSNQIELCLNRLKVIDRRDIIHSLKWYRLNGYIFKYYYKGVVYFKGAWIPKVKPKDLIIKVKSLRKDISDNERCWIERREYSYETLRMEEKEKIWITEEEFNSQESAIQLLEKHEILYSV